MQQRIGPSHCLSVPAYVEHDRRRIFGPENSVRRKRLGALYRAIRIPVVGQDADRLAQRVDVRLHRPSLFVVAVAHFSRDALREL